MTKRAAASRPQDSAGLTRKVAALARLVREFDLRSAPQSFATVEAELLDAIGRAEMLGTARSSASGEQAARLLDELRGEVEPEVDRRGPPLAGWQDPTLTMEQSLGWLRLTIAFDFETAMHDRYGWRISQAEWLEGSARTRWLVDEAQAVLDPADPIAAARTWLDHPPAPPDRL